MDLAYSDNGNPFNVVDEASRLVFCILLSHVLVVEKMLISLSFNFLEEVEVE